MTATLVATSLELDSVEVRSGGRVLVSVPQLRAVPGRPLTIIGESGAGKSLLAHAAMGTLDPGLTATGTMRLGGSTFDLSSRTSRRGLWGHSLALLPQEPSLALDPTMRVLPQVAEGAPLADRHVARTSAAALLGSLGLTDVGQHWPHTLSGGMAQRVSYAAATIPEPGVLLVDEPSKGLDARSLDLLAELLLRHSRAGGVLVTITHDLELARRLGGDVAVMKDAKVIETGAIDDVLGRPAHEHTRRLVGADPALWPARAGGPQAVEAPPSSGVTALISLEQVGVVLGGRPVLSGVDLSVGQGERWALVGPSGAGKTTLGNVLAGVQPVDVGRVVRHASLRPGQVAKLYQDPQASFPAKVPLVAGLRDVARRFGADWTRVTGLLDEVGVPADLLDRRPGQVSGGELQRIAIVRSMLPSPRLVIADEATSRLDLLTQQTTVRALLTEIDASGSALVLVTHDRALARACTDHVLDLTPRAILGGRDQRTRPSERFTEVAGWPSP
ncbi:ATP-binding cassette domain-containing protein [Knoellia sp. S7-12]|uniref:ABC transporter ATP-binding protein n=1 Tax=Knoellia sp. S7-12 TaxID=3126698 RepID=UPI003367B121